MLRTQYCRWIAALSCAGLLAMAAPANAQHHHGGHHGGHHHGGGHLHGGHHHGGHHHGHYYGSYGLGYGYYPSYGYGYGYSNYPSSYIYAPAYYPQALGVSAGQVYYQQSPAIPSQPQAASLGNTAVIHALTGHHDAQIWLDDQPTTTRGTTRQYVTPELTPGKTYWYTVKISRNQGGQTVSEERQVEVSAGKVSSVDFTQPAPPEKVAAPK